jgi:hypothetical protein
MFSIYFIICKTLNFDLQLYILLAGKKHVNKLNLNQVMDS